MSDELRVTIRNEQIVDVEVEQSSPEECAATMEAVKFAFALLGVSLDDIEERKPPQPEVVLERQKVKG